MNFLGDLVKDAIESKFSGGSSQSQSAPQTENYNSSSGPGYGRSEYNSAPPAPQAPYPWVSRWDDRDQRWYFLNEQTGQTSWEVPGSAPPGSGGYGGGYGNSGYGAPQQQGYYGGGSGGYAQEGYYEQSQRQEVPVQQEQKSSHTGLYVAGGVAAGALGGALLMHEGEEIHDEFDEDKARLEQNVEDFPEDAARWTGEAVGEVEQVPDRIEDGFDDIGDNIEDAVDDVEDFPEDAARWTGEKVGEVEQFGDNMENAYDQGEAEGRSDDW
ncbi:hypothetical protein BJX99DRAFT_241050 [Aspergillus californicus]